MNKYIKKAMTLVATPIDTNNVKGDDFIIDSIGGNGVAGADSGFTNTAMNKKGGVNAYVGDQFINECGIEVKMVNSGNANKPLVASLLAACAMVVKPAQVSNASKMSGDFTSEEEIVVSAVPAGVITVDAEVPVGSLTFDIESDTTVTLLKGTNFTIAGNPYRLAVEVDLVAITPAAITITSVTTVIISAAAPVTLTDGGLLGRLNGRNSDIQINGVLTNNAIGSISDETMDLKLVGARYGCNYFGFIPANSILEFDSNAVKVIEDVIFTETDEILTISVAPLTAVSTASSVVTVTNRRIFIHDIANNVAIDTEIEGLTSGVTGQIVNIYSDALECYTDLELSHQESIEISEYVGDLWFQMQNGRGNAAFDYTPAAQPKATFSFKGTWNKLRELAFDDSIDVPCQPSHSSSGAKLFINNYDTDTQHSMGAVTFDLGNAVTADENKSCDNGVSGFIVSDQIVVGTMKLTTTLPSIYAPDLERFETTSFSVLYTHKGNDENYHRITHIVPNAQHTALPSREDMGGFESLLLAIGAITGCFNVPQKSIYFY